MDFFDFLILAALALPAIFRWLSERSRAGDAGQPPVATDEPDAVPHDSGETEFQRALREISQALAGGPSEREAEPAEQVDESFREFSPPHWEGTRTTSGFSREEAFEKEVAESSRHAATVPFKRLKLRRIEAPEIEQVSTPAGGRRSGIPTFLRGAKSVRQAIIASEVIGRPLALRDTQAEESL